MDNTVEEPPRFTPSLPADVDELPDVEAYVTVSNLAVGDVIRLVSDKHATVTADEGTTDGLRRLLLDLEGCTTSVLWRATDDVEIVATVDQKANA